MSEFRTNLQAIFSEAAEIASVLERSAFLDFACGVDTPLRARVEQLLVAHAAAGNFLSDPVPAQPQPTSINSLNGTLGDFRLIREIGRGGMGVVYEAEQISLERRVALKVLPFAALLDQRQLKRFVTEAKAAAALEHPHIVNVLNVGNERGVHYYAMQFVEGHDVAALIQQLQELSTAELPATEAGDFELAVSLVIGKFEPPDATRRIGLAEQRGSNATVNSPASQTQSEPLKNSTDDTHPFALFDTQASTSRREYFRTIAGLGIQAADALDYAHNHGILHRDIKPSNLMLNADGDLLVTDFGLARVEGDVALTMTGDVMGTLRYMSPEQAKGDNDAVDGRSDVYSLGVTLYELLTLRPLYPGTDHHELLRQREEADPIAPRQINKAIPADLETVVLKAIAKNPAERYATAGEFAEDLQRFVNNEPVVARRPTLATRVVKWAQRNRAIALSFAAAFVGGIVAASAVVAVIKDRDGDKAGQVVVPEAGTAIILDGRSTPPHRLDPTNLESPAASALPGIIPHPQELPGVGRWQLIATRPGRPVTGRSWTLDWSPDGKFISFGDGVHIRVYAVPSFRLAHLFSGHTNAVNSVSWSPDGKWIASAGTDQTVRLWNVETGEPGPVLVGHRDRVDAVAWHPDSRRIVSGGRDGWAIIWTVAGNLKRILPRHPGDVSSVSWSPDGELLATGTGGSGDTIDAVGGKIRIWNRQGLGDQIRVIDTRGEQIKSLDWSPDGGRILNRTQIWGVDGTELVTLKGHAEYVCAASWSPDGKRVATASKDDTVRLWEADGTPGPVLRASHGEMFCVKWSPDGQWIATGGKESPVRLWRPDGTPGPILASRESIPDFAWHPDGKIFAAACCDKSLRLFNSDGTAIGTLEGYRFAVTRVDWNPAGDCIASGSGREFMLRQWNPDQTPGPIIARQSHNANSFVFSPDGRRLAGLFGGPTHSVGLLTLGESAVMTSLGSANDFREITWNPRGDRIASVGFDNLLRVWTLDGKAEVILDNDQHIGSVDWKPDGTQIACGCLDGRIQLCRLDGRESILLEGHQECVTQVRWSGDGKMIASGDNGSMVRIWTETGRSVATLAGHTGTIMELAWRPHSHQLISAGRDGTIRFWNADTQSIEWFVIVLPGKQSITLSPQGRILNGDPQVFESEFAYIVEKPTGAMEVVKPSEFQKRVHQKNVQPAVPE